MDLEDALKAEEGSGSETTIALTHELCIVQQPLRARMCGFGDKDRRPISPPLIVRLETITQNGSKLSPSDMDPTTFILAVDLRHGHDLADANIVPVPPSASASGSTHRSRSRTSPSSGTRHSTSSRSLTPPSSSTIPSAYPSLRPSPSGLVCSDERGPPPESPHLSPDLPWRNDSDGRPVKKRRRSSSADPGASSLVQADDRAAPFGPNYHPNEASLEVPNLIGTLHASSHVLSDPEGERGSKGIYFVLPDLSVRMEGTFRLRLRLLSIDLSSSLPVSPVVASTYTDEFQVYNAKKFPGMLGPTPLSKFFASQGVRIPTRQSKKSSPAASTTPSLAANDPQ
ncbi:hypothetical protein JCM3766R1_003015 [Sporobolomyces carnicolor]